MHSMHCYAAHVDKGLHIGISQQVYGEFYWKSKLPRRVDTCSRLAYVIYSVCDDSESDTDKALELWRRLVID